MKSVHWSQGYNLLQPVKSVLPKQRILQAEFSPQTRYSRPFRISMEIKTKINKWDLMKLDVIKLELIRRA